MREEHPEDGAGEGPEGEAKDSEPGAGATGDNGLKAGAAAGDGSKAGAADGDGPKAGSINDDGPKAGAVDCDSPGVEASEGCATTWGRSIKVTAEGLKGQMPVELNPALMVSR